MVMSIEEIAAEKVRYYEAGDYAGGLALLSSQARIWHSTDSQWQSVEEVRASFVEHGVLNGGPPFSNCKVTTTESGYVLQALVQLSDSADVHICQVVGVEDGLVTSVEEYIAVENPL